ncbi:protein kinase domain-containing protein [Almyronema epifaneia]|uniref:Protein kinase n=1 Tax=Almyronema epifaneia S1 TaxID=2991925 RepID=A0ABW6IDZ4_9CYAN
MTLCLNPLCPQPQNPAHHRYCQSCGRALLLGDRYRPLQQIGQGGFGRTLLAIDEATQSHCVIKQFLRSPEPQRFQQEVKQLTQLGQHRQIPQLLEALTTAEGSYLIQEFIQGTDLETLLQRHGVFTEAQIRTLLVQILSVLAFVHQAQVIHRDVKPANILYVESSQTYYLVDFGASKYADGQEALKQKGTVIGSAGYAAPEQMLGQAVFASDLYSLGVTCIHLLTGQHPFDLYSIGEDRWVWRPYVRQGVSLQLGHILERLLSRSLQRRYRAAADVLRDLQTLGTRHQLSQRRLQPPRLAAPPSLNWRCVFTLPQAGSIINTLSISPDGRAVATGSTDKAVRLWDLRNGELIQTLGSALPLLNKRHRGAVNAVLFSADGRSLFSGSSDGTVKWWDLTDYSLVATLPEPGWTITAIALTPDNQFLIGGGGEGKLRLWQLETLALAGTFSQHREQISGLDVVGESDQLISSSWDQSLRLWHLPTGQLLKTLKRAHEAAITCLGLRQTLVVSGDAAGIVKLWDWQHDWRSQTLKAHSDTVTAIALSPDGQFLVTGSDDSTLVFWHLPTAKRVGQLNHAWGIRAVGFTPDGQTCVSSSADETLKIWQRLP